jgi:hypothetical protein
MSVPAIAVRAYSSFVHPVGEPEPNMRQPHAPNQEHGFFEKVKDKFSAHNAAPGPVMHGEKLDAKEEGTQAERLAKAQELNK